MNPDPNTMTLSQGPAFEAALALNYQNLSQHLLPQSPTSVLDTSIPPPPTLDTSIPPPPGFPVTDYSQTSPIADSTKLPSPDLSAKSSSLNSESPNSDCFNKESVSVAAAAKSFVMPKPYEYNTSSLP